jgi:hypothetical protein
MSSDSDKPNPRPSDDQDLGPPIADLLNLEQDTSPAFLSSIRKKIYRRVMASQFASFSWDLPKMILLEFWKMLVELSNPRASQKGGRS